MITFSTVMITFSMVMITFSSGNIINDILNILSPFKEYQSSKVIKRLIFSNTLQKNVEFWIIPPIP